MQLSAPSLPIDSNSPLSPDAAVTPRTGGEPPAPGEFGALLTAETKAAPTPPAAKAGVSPVSPLGQNLAALLASAIAGSADPADTVDALPVATSPQDPTDLSLDPAVCQDALAGWLAANGFSPAPPVVPAPETAELDISLAQNSPATDGVSMESPTLSSDANSAIIPTAVARSGRQVVGSPVGLGSLAGTALVVAKAAGEKTNLTVAEEAAGKGGNLPTVPSPVTEGQSPVAPSSGPNSPTEKIAAVSGAFIERFEIKKDSGLKKSLPATEESVTETSSDLGTNVAKPVDPMPALATSSHRPSDAIAPLSFSPGLLSLNSLVKETPAPAGIEFVNSAQHAVESVLAAGDRLATNGQHGVNLQFSVSGVELSVRVEMRGGNVQTTFRTDSPELRTALAHEWQAVVATQSSDRPQRLADPVFASSSGDSMSSDSGTAQQREPGARQGQPTTQEFSGLLGGSRPQNGTTTAATANVPVRSVPVSTPGRLHAFA